jgi:hypothetical protein
MKTIEDYMGKRTWNDSKKRKDIVKGKFSDDEVKTLMHTLCQVVKE